MTREEQEEILAPFKEAFLKHRGHAYYKSGADFGAIGRVIQMETGGPDEYRAKIRGYFAEPQWEEFGRYKFHVFVNNYATIKPIYPRDERKIVRQMITCDCGASFRVGESHECKVREERE